MRARWIARVTVAKFQDRWQWLPQVLTRRRARTFGTRGGDRIAGDSRSLDGPGRDLGAGPTEAELRHLGREERATCADDVVWRRAKRAAAIAATDRDVRKDHAGDDRRFATRDACPMTEYVARRRAGRAVGGGR